jgi:hypothetical protein
MTNEEEVAILKELPYLSLKANTNWAIERDINYQDAVNIAIKALEQTRWVPVSERLPEESDYVSCIPFYDGVVIWITDKGFMGFGWYYNSTNNWADTNDCWSDKYGEVTAWMPLPEPYVPQESEET